MTPETVAYIKSQKPQIDVLGRWVYLANARTGSTSITGGLLSDRVVIHHRGEGNWERVWNKVIEPRIEEMVIFTFVRNPWDRVVSAWRLLRDKGRISQTESLPEFLGDGALGDPKHEHFFQPQTASYMHGGVAIPEVFIGRHETREKSWQRIAGHLGIAESLPHRNATKHSPYWAYYDPQTVRIVRRAYAAEIEILGYEFSK